MTEPAPLPPSTGINSLSPAHFQEDLASLADKGKLLGRNYLILNASKDGLQKTHVGKYLVEVCKQFFLGKSRVDPQLLKQATKEFLGRGISSLAEKPKNGNEKQLNDIQNLANRVHLEKKDLDPILTSLKISTPSETTPDAKSGPDSILSQPPLKQTSNAVKAQVKDSGEAMEKFNEIMKGLPDTSFVIKRSPTGNLQVCFIGKNGESMKQIKENALKALQDSGFSPTSPFEDSWRSEGTDESPLQFSLSSNETFFLLGFFKKSDEPTFKKIMQELQTVFPEPIQHTKTEPIQVTTSEKKMVETFEKIQGIYRGSNIGGGGGQSAIIRLDKVTFFTLATGGRASKRMNAEKWKLDLLKNNPDYIADIYPETILHFGSEKLKVGFLNDKDSELFITDTSIDLNTRVELAIIEDVINYLLIKEAKNFAYAKDITPSQFADGLREVLALQKKHGVDYRVLLNPKK